jgi:hypothetical protein
MLRRAMRPWGAGCGGTASRRCCGGASWAPRDSGAGSGLHRLSGGVRGGVLQSACWRCVAARRVRWRLFWRPMSCRRRHLSSQASLFPPPSRRASLSTTAQSNVIARAALDPSCPPASSTDAFLTAAPTALVSSAQNSLRDTTFTACQKLAGAAAPWRASSSRSSTPSLA